MPRLKQLAGCYSCACPAVFEILAETACVPCSCPLVAKFGSDYVIVGKRTSAKDHADLDGRISGDEEAIVISSELIRKALGVDELEEKLAKLERILELKVPTI